ncbi:Hypothetical_protein [Hexamita inflata]|uniref:Hypothetical_protein n=1 Tax=Hexamita inflata TaxID=28002 RepID=A0AA86P0U5_9EUKA|nr:Hypothetical protein HINF_LOCUS17158 [Hexamita inflata]
MLGIQLFSYSLRAILSGLITSLDQSIYPTHLTFIYTCMVYVSSACLRGQHTQCWRIGLIPSRRWKYPSNSVASWPSSFRFDFTYFPTGQVGMPVSEHLQCSRLITGLQFSIGVSRIGIG